MIVSRLRAKEAVADVVPRLKFAVDKLSAGPQSWDADNRAGNYRPRPPRIASNEANAPVEKRNGPRFLCHSPQPPGTTPPTGAKHTIPPHQKWQARNPTTTPTSQGNGGQA